jgi:hypothetical protein
MRTILLSSVVTVLLLGCTNKPSASKPSQPLASKQPTTAVPPLVVEPLPSLDTKFLKPGQIELQRDQETRIRDLKTFFRAYESFVEKNKGKPPREVAELKEFLPTARLFEDFENQIYTMPQNNALNDQVWVAYESQPYQRKRLILYGDGRVSLADDGTFRSQLPSAK